MPGGRPGPVEHTLAHPHAESPVLAVDIGGTKIEVAVVDVDGVIGSRARIPTPATDDADELFGELDAVIGRVRSASTSEPVVCGIGCGGPMEPGGATVSPLNITAWRDFAKSVAMRRISSRMLSSRLSSSDSKSSVVSHS